jgi:CelD/BcsL family acetyltransferase involved in cellulose biosynthesis
MRGMETLLSRVDAVVTMPMSRADELETRDYAWRDVPQPLKQGWEALVDNGGFDYSLSPEWTGIAASSLSFAERLRVLVAYENGRVCGVLPYFLNRTAIWGVPITTLELAGNKLVSYHQEIVATDCQAALLGVLLKSHKWHLFAAEGLPVGGPTANAVRAQLAEFGDVLLTFPGERSPYLPITTDWEAFCKARSQKFRYNLKRKEKGLRAAGAVHEKWFAAPADVAELYDAMLAIESKSWKLEAGTAVSQRQLEQTYYQKLLPHLAARGALFANVLYLDDKPIAYNLCCSWNGRLGQLKTTFDEALRDLSPGSVVIHFAVRKAFQTGAKEFDFLGDAMPHKLEWTDEIRAHESYHVFSRHWRSRLLGRIKRYARNRREARGK